MPYLDNGQKTNDIGHCRVCNFQWVVKDGTKGAKHGYATGRVCPFCKNNSVYYTKERTWRDRPNQVWRGLSSAHDRGNSLW